MGKIHTHKINKCRGGSFRVRGIEPWDSSLPDYAGSWASYGVPPRAEIQASKEGVIPGLVLVSLGLDTQRSDANAWKTADWIQQLLLETNVPARMKFLMRSYRQKEGAHRRDKDPSSFSCTAASSSAPSWCCFLWSHRQSTNVICSLTAHHKVKAGRMDLRPNNKNV